MKKSFLTILMLGLALGLTACSTNNKGVDPAIDKDAPADQDTDSEKEIDEIEAFDTFVDKYPNATVTKVGLDEDSKEYYYKVEGFENGKEIEIKIKKLNGEIFKEELEEGDNNDKDIAITKADVEKVKSIVDKVIASADDNAKLDEWTLETEFDRLVVEIEIDQPDSNDIENTYDLQTGELLESDD